MLLFPTTQASKTSLPRGTNCGPEELVKTNHKRLSIDQSSQRTKAKKRRLDDPEVLQVPLGEATIECLMQGQRPTKSDVVMPLEESQLVPMFELLQEYQDTLKTRKPYQKKASVPKD